MVQLREDILEEVTEAYFARRGVQIALMVNPPADQHALLQRELELQELTAVLDGYTGGAFSAQMQPHVND
jgi:hypothetical protein